MGKENRPPKSSKVETKDDAKYAELENAEKGKVVVRFPPEASGYLHIGHAKAALLNQYYQLAFDGKLVFRFDDTNPEKEKEDFEHVITEDVELLKIQPDIRSYTSDHFEMMLVKVEQLLKEGKAYVDDTPGDQMKTEREQRVESKNRNNAVQINLERWEQMKQGNEYGQTCCVRAKIDMRSPNGCLRDPTLYRCKNQAHPRTGNKYRVYPTYDFACPIVDSVEGITHALRTTEYADRDPQFFWVLEALGMRKPYIYAYSRLNMTHTVLSKRKLTWFVENGHVSGWDDPRMPTVRGILRRGLAVDGLKQFIIAQGSSRAVVFMEWDKIWSFNRKVIDPMAVRYMGIEAKNHVIVDVENVQQNELEIDCHPKNPELGKRKMNLSNQLLIDQIDASLINENEFVTFIYLGNAFVTKVTKDSNGIVQKIAARLDPTNKDFKKTLKVTWLDAKNTEKAVCYYYENLITKPILDKDDEFKDFINKESKLEAEFLVEAPLKSLAKNSIIQILRKGFFICDEPFNKNTTKKVETPNAIALISISDGSNDLNNYPIHVQEAKLRFRKHAAALTITKKTKEALKPVVAVGGDETSLYEQVRKQGEQVRDLKSKKADKATVDQAVQELLQLKAKYKEQFGKDYNPNSPPQPIAAPVLNDAQPIIDQIKAQGDKIRQLKSNNAGKEQLQPEIDTLLKLKQDYKSKTGKDWTPSPTATVAAPTKPAAPFKPKEKQEQKPKAPKEKQETKPKAPKEKQSGKKQTRLCIEAKKMESFADWYTEVITKSEMLEYYDISGCYILRPWAYSIWESIVAFFNERIKSLGVQNCSFPIFVSQSALEREKNHIADFAPEVAWVTKSGSSDLVEPIAIRPTSETVMYPSYSKWIKSHRDLPLKLNQWCNVVRWEFKDPTPFLRSREFLWQEGHTAHATKEEAIEEVHTILDFYARVYEELLAVPMIKGRKTEKEKFPGGDMTTTIEGFISTNGRGIQAATSHFLGQNFSKMFDITFDDGTGTKKLAYQNSWGLTTRAIGVMVMEHSDDQGLVLPPRVAPIQVVIIPCGITASSTKEERESLVAEAKKLAKALQTAEVIVQLDDDDHNSPGWKYNHWELKGVPIRIEFGPKDLAKGEFVTARRDTGAKSSHKITDVVTEIRTLLDQIQTNLFETARAKRDAHVKVVHSMDEFVHQLNQKCLVQAPFCGGEDCEESIKKQSAKTDDASGPLMGAKSLCIPFQQPADISAQDHCVNPECQTKPQFYTLFGRSY